MRRLLFVIFCLLASSNVASLPPSPVVLFLDEEIAADEEEIEDNGIDDAAEDIAAADAPAEDNIDYATMPPKVKPIPTAKAAPKKESATATALFVCAIPSRLFD